MGLEEIKTHDRVTTADVEARTPGLQHDSDLPPARERMGPIGRAFFSAATIIPGLIGIAIPLGLLSGFAIADGADVAPGASEETTIALWMQACAGISAVIAGVLIWRGGLIPVLVATIAAVAFGVLGFVIL